MEAITQARRRYGHTLGVAWFSAHFCGDLAVGWGRVALIGARSMTTVERSHIWSGRVRHLTVAAARVPAVVSSCVLETDADEVYLHVDPSVLDPAEFDGVRHPVPGGMVMTELVAAIRAIGSALPVIGSSVAACEDSAQLQRLGPLLDVVGEVCGQRS